MEVFYKNHKIAKICEDYSKLRKKYGDDRAKEINKRIEEMKAAESLYDISKLPQARLHPLHDDLTGRYSVDITHPFRIIILPMNGNAIGLTSITKVKLEDIKNTH